MDRFSFTEIIIIWLFCIGYVHCWVRRSFFLLVPWTICNSPAAFVQKIVACIQFKDNHFSSSLFPINFLQFTILLFRSTAICKISAYMYVCLYVCVNKISAYYKCILCFKNNLCLFLQERKEASLQGQKCKNQLGIPIYSVLFSDAIPISSNFKHR